MSSLTCTVCVLTHPQSSFVFATPEMRALQQLDNAERTVAGQKKNATGQKQTHRDKTAQNGTKQTFLLPVCLFVFVPSAVFLFVFVVPSALFVCPVLLFFFCPMCMFFCPVNHLFVLSRFALVLSLCLFVVRWRAWKKSTTIFELSPS